jgi:hypothetical protein
MRTDDLIDRLNALLPHVPRNRGNVEHLILALGQVRVTALSVVYANEPTEDRAEELARDMASLKTEYSRLWLSANKPERLDILESRFDDLISFYWRESGLESREGAPPISEVPWPGTYLNPISYDLHPNRPG